MTIHLEADALTKSWAGRRVFDRVSLTAGRGLVAVAGENGSGKTTLLKILASLLRADSGKVFVRRDGLDLSGDARRGALGWAGPDLAFYDDLTAEENLRFFRRAAGRPADLPEIRARIEAVGLSRAAAGRPAGAFSTGMKQRLRIAFATLFDAPILLLDEPMTGLDAGGREIVSGIIAERRREGAVVLASNDPRDFADADSVVRLPGAAVPAGAERG